MVTKMTPNYTNVFMGKLDDIFTVWSHTEEEWVYFIDQYNTAHTRIFFTHSYFQTKINFLDVTVKIDVDKLATSLYRKPADRQQYLHYLSGHTHHCKNRILYSQAHRFKRICSKDTIFDPSSQNLKSA